MIFCDASANLIEASCIFPGYFTSFYFTKEIISLVLLAIAVADLNQSIDVG